MEKRVKKFGQGPPPPLFGQCPKEIDFFYGRCSLRMVVNLMFFLELLGIISWLRLKTPLNPLSVDLLDPMTMHSKNPKNIKKEPKVIFTT